MVSEARRLVVVRRVVVRVGWVCSAGSRLGGGIGFLQQFTITICLP